jgi:simple sugar transport system permease protein
VPEVLTSLLLVTVAANVVGYGLKNTWLLLAPAEGRANRNQVSKQLALDSRLPRATLFGNEVPLAVIIGLLVAVAVHLVLTRTTWGFRLRMLGHSPRTARRAGVPERSYGLAAIAVSGGFAGLAGAVMLAGGDFGNYQLVPGFSVGIGWAGLLVALVAREKAVAAIAVACVFASLRTGSGFLAATGVHRRITDVVQALLVLALIIPPLSSTASSRWSARRPSTRRPCGSPWCWPSRPPGSGWRSGRAPSTSPSRACCSAVRSPPRSPTTPSGRFRRGWPPGWRRAWSSPCSRRT